MRPASPAPEPFRLFKVPVHLNAWMGTTVGGVPMGWLSI